MRDWNAVVCVHEHGVKRARDVFGDFGEVMLTEFFNVLLVRAEDLSGMLETLRERFERAPDSLSFLSRLVPVTRTFIFNSAEEFESKSGELVLGWARDLRGRRFHVRIHRRGFKGRIRTPDEERLLDDTLLDHLEKSGERGHIDFNDPDFVIAIETSGTWAGAGLLSRDEMIRYRFLRPE